jgi:riboflavin biosynthesis pyrimidine reductase
MPPAAGGARPGSTGDACQDAGVHLLFDRRGTPPGLLGQAELVELLRFPVPPSDAWLRTNFVATVDGSITGPDASSGSISPASDQHQFALHRALCDAVVVAGGTARAEGYRSVDLADWERDLRAAEGLAPYPTLVVVTASANLDPQVATPAQGAGGPVVVATTVAASAGRLDPLRAAGVEVLQRGSDEVDLSAVLDELAGRGLPRLLCEGGPSLHRDLLAHGLVDEVLLTHAPQLVAGSGSRTTRGPGLDDPVGLALSYVLRADDDALFTSYRTLPEKPVGRLE